MTETNLQFIQLNSDQKENKTSPLAVKIGDVLNAHVLELLEGALLLDIEGHLVKANVKQSEQYAANQTIALKVVDLNDQTLTVVKAENAGLNSDTAIGDEEIGKLLESLNIQDSEKARSALVALNAYKNPMNSGTVKALLAQFNALEMVQKALPQEAVFSQENLKNSTLSLKDFAILLQKMDVSTGQPKVIQSTPQSTEIEPSLMVQAKQADGSTFEALPLKSNNPQVESLLITDEIQLDYGRQKTEGKFSDEGPFKQLGHSTAIAVDGTVVDFKRQNQEQTLGLPFRLDGLESLKDPKEAMKALSFLMKIGVEATPQSLFAIDQVLKGTALKTILSEVVGINQGNHLSEEAVQALETFKTLLKAFEPDLFKNQDHFRKMVESLVDTAKALESTVDQKSLVNQEPAQINKAIGDTFRQNPLSFILTTFPLMVNDQLETLALYVDKRQRHKAIDPEDVKLYLSLSTEKLGQVGAMITILLKSITIDFDTVNEEVNKAIEVHQNSLIAALEPLGYKISIQTHTRVKPVSLLDLEEQFDPIPITRFDKRV